MKNLGEFKKWYDEADQAGKAEAGKLVPVPMVVQQLSNVMDDTSPVKQEWLVSDGVCGFAWVKVYPGNCPFANWMKKQGLADKSYEGGVSLWVSGYGQSMQKKEAYAGAFAKVLQGYGLRAYAGSRMD